KTDVAMRASDTVSMNLKHIAASALEIDCVIGEINTSSQSQRNSIDQVNAAMTGMNQAVQTTAMVAETSAARAAELSEQASVFQNAVSRLSTLTGERDSAAVAGA